MSDFVPTNDTIRLAALSAAQAMIEFTPEGNILSANDNFLSRLGYRLADVVGKHHRIFVSPQYANSAEYAEFWRRLAAGEAFTGEFERFDHYGKSVWINGSYAPLLDSNGRIIGVLKMATDITDEKTAMAQIIQGLGDIAEGRLGIRLLDDMPAQFLGVRDSVNRTAENFANIVDAIRERSDLIAQEAAEIAGGADDLARRGASQASALEQTAAAVEQISGNTAMTSHSAQEASTATQEAEKVVKRGNAIVANAVAAIERIEEHTKSMGEFTRVIENFAFQTNLLSINAAVEAARAGEVGRGFAVVAQEVRNLAQQSGKASQSIAELISKSETEVQSGVTLVRQTGTALNDIQTAVQGVVENISGIAHATAEQNTGVNEVSCALSQLDSVNQANLSMSESYATAATSLSSQVSELSELLGQFDTGKQFQNNAQKAQKAA